MGQTISTTDRRAVMPPGNTGGILCPPRGLLIAWLVLLPVPLIAQQAPPDDAPPNAADQANPPQPAANTPDSHDVLFARQKAIEKPLMGVEEDKRLKKEFAIRRGLVTNFRKAVLNDETRQLIDDWARWRLHRMTITEAPDPPANADPNDPPPVANIKKLAEIVGDTVRVIGYAGTSQNNPNAEREFRRYLLDKMIERSYDVLDNNYYVRLNTVLLLSQLNIVRGEGLRQEGAVPYVHAAKPLLFVLEDENQHEGVKIPAVRGLKRILEHGSFPTREEQELKNKIVVGLIRELEGDFQSWWYPRVLVQALGAVEEPLIEITKPNGTAERKPFHVHALAVAVRDDKHHWMVRSEASQALGRVALHATVNPEVITHEVVNLGYRMAREYNKDHAKLADFKQQIEAVADRDPDKAEQLRRQAEELPRWFWLDGFFKLYYTFKPTTIQELRRLQQIKPANLVAQVEAGAKTATDAYNQVLPLVRSVLNDQPIPDEQLQTVQDWLTKNQPSNALVAPGLPALDQVQPMAAKGEIKTEPTALATE